MFELFMIIGGALLRLVPHVPNFAPVAATALFGGTYLKKKYAIIIPMGILFLSDYLLLYINPFSEKVVNFDKVYPITAIFHPSTFYVWGSFLIVGFIGLWLRNHKSAHNVILSSLISSILFFLVTNFGYWLSNSLYPKTFEGQMTAYVMALPFFKWTILGDLFYTGVFFGAYEFALKAVGRKNVAVTV